MDYISTLESFIIEDSALEVFGEGKRADEKWLAFFKRKIVELFRWLAEKWRNFVQKIKNFFGKGKEKEASANTSAENAKLKEELSRKEAKIDELSKKIDDLKAENGRNSSRSSEQDAQLKKMEEAMKQIQADADTLEERLKKSKVGNPVLKEAYNHGKNMGYMMLKMLALRTHHLENDITNTTSAIRKIVKVMSSGEKLVANDLMYLQTERHYERGDKDSDGDQYINDVKIKLHNLLEKYEDDYEMRKAIGKHFGEGFSESGINASEIMARSGKTRVQLEQVLKTLQGLTPKDDGEASVVRMALSAASNSIADWDRCNRIYLNAISFVTSVQRDYNVKSGLQSEL